MSIRKRNEFLDGDDSEEEVDNDYDSEAEQGRGAIGNRTNKRRKVDTESEASFEGLDEEQEVEENLLTAKDDRFDFSRLEGEDEAEVENVVEANDEIQVPSNHDRTKPSKAAKQVEAAAKAVRKSGVIYISRVPPFMKPHTLKSFLEPHASKGLGRIFLTPEDHAAHTKRVKNGGNKKKSFTDGWVEFKSKKEAQVAAETLNGNLIGGKKGNFYHDDLWNMKYLKGFKWDNLTEQIANENAERQAKMKQEIWRTRQENKAFVEDVERAKMLEGMEAKKKAKREKEGGSAVSGEVINRPGMEFKQKKAQMHSGKQRDKKAPVESGKALSKIFG